MTRYNTDPTDEDRDWAREQLYRAGSEPCARQEYAIELLGSRLDLLRDAVSEFYARLIARGRAVFDAYRQEPK